MTRKMPDRKTGGRRFSRNGRGACAIAYLRRRLGVHLTTLSVLANRSHCQVRTISRAWDDVPIDQLRTRLQREDDS